MRHAPPHVVACTLALVALIYQAASDDVVAVILVGCTVTGAFAAELGYRRSSGRTLPSASASARRGERGPARDPATMFDRYGSDVEANRSFDPAALVEWALESLRTSSSTGVVLGEEHLLLVANERARSLLELGEIPPAGIDWVGLTPSEYRVRDDLAISDAKHYGASAWYQKEFVVASGERRRVELLVLALQTEPFRWLALLRTAGSSPMFLPGRQHASVTLRLARRLAGAGTFDDVMRIIDLLSTGALEADHVSVGLLDEDGSTMEVHYDPMTARRIARKHPTIDVSEATMLGTAALRDAAEFIDVDAYEVSYPSGGIDARGMQIEQLAAVPMHDRNGELVGVLGIGWTSRGERDMGHIESVAELIGDAIRLARDADRNRATAAAFQEMLLPTHLDSADPALVDARYYSVDHSVGGDFYDVVTRDGRRTWFVIGDVVGHGIAASRTMGKIRFFLRALLLDAVDPAELLDSLNQLVLAEGYNEMATCLVAVWDRVGRTLTYSSAGHLAQLIIIDGDVRLLLPPPDPPVGVVRSAAIHPSTEIDIGSGATLVLYTDGLVERRDLAIDESLAGLRDMVGSWPQLEPRGAPRPVGRRRSRRS